jgi:addiction module RelE/StbE family toxin
MRIKFSPLVIKELTKIKKKDKRLVTRIQKQLQLFSVNPKHPSLRIHKLTGSMNNVWSLSVTESIRMVYRFINEDTAYFVDIGTHNQVYK